MPALSWTRQKPHDSQANGARHAPEAGSQRTHAAMVLCHAPLCGDVERTCSRTPAARAAARAVSSSPRSSSWPDSSQYSSRMVRAWLPPRHFSASTARRTAVARGGGWLVAETRSASASMLASDAWPPKATTSPCLGGCCCCCCWLLKRNTPSASGGVSAVSRRRQSHTSRSLLVGTPHAIALSSRQRPLCCNSTQTCPRSIEAEALL